MQMTDSQIASMNGKRAVELHERSWWLDEALHYEKAHNALPVLKGEVYADVAIVGGGYTGLWTAVQLKIERPDLNVIVIEANICGAGASGKNAGKVHGYWMSLSSLASSLGKEDALEVARLGSVAQQHITDFVKASDVDVWWLEGGGLKVATTADHEAKLRKTAQTMIELGSGSKAKLLSARQVSEHCSSPSFRNGIFYPEEATVHPARLARAIRAHALALGVKVFENTPALLIKEGRRPQVTTPDGIISADHVVLATNVGLLKQPDVAAKVVAFSSYALVTDPNEDIVGTSGWKSDCSLSDSRMFLHYSRKTADGRVLFGAGSGPIGYGSRVEAKSLSMDTDTVERVERGFRHLFPHVTDMQPSRAWGGAIDVSSDRLPFARTKPGTNVHYACGFSGHGINPSYIMGRCLASLVLGKDNEWTRSAFCTRALPNLPPEPFRYLGGRMIRSSILACEDADERDQKAPAIARMMSRLPELLNLRIGVR
ncbi:FAD-dependent oxidoreductase [Agrobacterium larrymoorei]|nr:FAD-dependent oxidoreductase [Agrobacterium larrymoorei]QYA10110.1 FAD-dependent oxidoreductase [Agrobacterium larrymoorei]